MDTVVIQDPYYWIRIIYAKLVDYSQAHIRALILMCFSRVTPLGVCHQPAVSSSCAPERKWIIVT